MRPSFGAEMEYDFEGDFSQEVVEKQNILHKICYDKFRSVAELAKVELLKSMKANIRFHEFTNSDGVTEQYPSVSSVASYDFDPANFDPMELNQYISHGNLYDIQCKHYVENGEWLPVEKINGTYTDLQVLRNGNLKLQVNDFNFPDFLKKYPIEKMQVGKLVFCHKHKTAGTPDIREGFYEGKKYMIDFKRTPNKSHFKQLAGYVLCEEENGATPYDGLMLIGCNSDTKQGFSKPMITTEVEQFKQMFIDCRKEFKKLFLI